MQNKFIVPQFIDAEDKIWGPITVRQFVLMLVGALIIFLSYKLSDFTLFLVQAIFTAIFIVVFAFYKVNGMPFHVFALNFVQTKKRPSIRVWKKEHIRIEKHKSKDEGEGVAEQYIKRKELMPVKKLSEISLVIDTGGVYKGEKYVNKEGQIFNSNN